MAKTSTITVNSVAFSAITTVTATPKVTINEDLGVASWPTTDFLVARTLSDTPKRIGAGGTYDFDVEGNWHAGEIVGYVKTVTGSTTFAQDEAWT